MWKLYMAQAVHGKVLGMFAFVLSLIRSSSFGYCMTQATVLLVLTQYIDFNSLRYFEYL